MSKIIDFVQVRRLTTGELYFAKSSEWRTALSTAPVALYLMREGSVFTEAGIERTRCALTREGYTTLYHGTVEPKKSNQTVSDLAEPVGTKPISIDVVEPLPEGKPPLTEQTAFLFDQKVLEWAEERNLLAGGTVDGQFKKLAEEFGELAAGLARGNIEEVKDAMGDMDVVLTIIAKMVGVTRNECRIAAYNEIKDRKGQMRGGTFVKEADL